ncbi:hypothetical protein Tco_0505232 [Tanacetum coccineum]
MSDSEDSTVTYTEAPPSPDYVSGPEEPEQAPPSPDFVPELVYPEFMPPEDDMLPGEEQPLPVAVSPIADSLCYITESNPEEDPEEDDEDPEEDLGDYPTDKDDDKEEEEESFRDELMRRRVAATLPLPSPPPSPLTSYSSPLPQISSPPLPVSSPLPISPSPLPASPTHSLGYRAAMIRLRTESPSTSTTTTYHTLTYQSIYGHDESCRTIHLLFSTSIENTTIRDTTTSTYTVTYIITTSTSTYTGLIDRILHEVHVPPQKRLLIALGPRYEIKESSSAPTTKPTGGFKGDYGFVSTMDAEIRRDLDREIDFVTSVRQDTDEIYELPCSPRLDLWRVRLEFLMRLEHSRWMPVIQHVDEVYFAFGRHLEEIHVAWAHLEKKQKRLQTNTKTLEDLYREYDLAPVKLVFEFSIYNAWKSVQYGVSNGLDMAYWEFLGVGTTQDTPYLLDGYAYWSSE